MYLAAGYFIACMRMPTIKFKNETCRAILFYLILHVPPALLLQVTLLQYYYCLSFM